MSSRGARNSPYDEPRGPRHPDADRSAHHSSARNAARQPESNRTARQRDNGGVTRHLENTRANQGAENSWKARNWDINGSSRQPTGANRASRLSETGYPSRHQMSGKGTPRRPEANRMAQPSSANRASRHHANWNPKTTQFGSGGVRRLGGMPSATQPKPPYGLVIALIVAVLVALGGLSSITSCMGRNALEIAGDMPEPIEQLEQYDWSNLIINHGRFAFMADGQTVSRLGVDVSESQGAIDWQAVADDGIEFAIIRVGYRGSTEGELYTDANFDANIDGAIDAGLDVGVYFYSQALTEDEAREEAQLCLYEINGRELQYPVAFDFELSATQSSRADGLDPNQAAANAKAFCDEIEKEGYQAMIYGNPSDLARYNLVDIEGYPIWYAEYGDLPNEGHEFTLWQYTNHGTVAGIDTQTDLNIDLSKAPTTTDAN